MDDLAHRILDAINESGLSYGELSKATGIPKSALQRYAVGTTEKVPILRVEQIGKAVGVSAAYLMGWSDNSDGHVDSATKLNSEESTPENTDHTADTLAVQKAMIAEKFKDLRISKGLTQHFVAEALGKKQQTVASWEKGQSQPDISTLLQFCNMCGVSVDSAFGRNVDDNLSLSEKQLIQQYRSLDAHGKHVVDTVLRLEVEHERSGQARC